MHLLALAAESREKEEVWDKQKATLETRLAQEVMKNEELRRDNLDLKALITSKSKNNNSNPALTVEKVRDSPVRDNFKYYTGFVYIQFMCIFNFLVPNELECPFHWKKTISSVLKIKLQDQFLLVMIKLRLNLEFKHIANLFNISPQDAGSLFREWINFMYYRFGSVPLWPERDVIIKNMPSKFREDFPTVLLILDGTELKMEKPSSLRSQSQCYSDYKSATTLKGLVGVDPRGSFTFISMLFSGAISDKEITNKCGLLDVLRNLLASKRLNPGDGVMVDKGFLIKEEIEKLGLKLYIPPFAPGCGQMPKSDVTSTVKIARHRVHVERAISRAQKFKIVDSRIEISLFPVINQIWFNCCFLTGFMPLLIQE